MSINPTQKGPSNNFDRSKLPLSKSHYREKVDYKTLRPDHGKKLTVKTNVDKEKQITSEIKTAEAAQTFIEEKREISSMKHPSPRPIKKSDTSGVSAKISLRAYDALPTITKKTSDRVKQEVELQLRKDQIDKIGDLFDTKSMKKINNIAKEIASSEKVHYDGVVSLVNVLDLINKSNSSKLVSKNDLELLKKLSSEVKTNGKTCQAGIEKRCGKVVAGIEENMNADLLAVKEKFEDLKKNYENLSSKEFSAKMKEIESGIYGDIESIFIDNDKLQEDIGKSVLSMTEYIIRAYPIIIKLAEGIKHDPKLTAEMQKIDSRDLLSLGGVPIQRAMRYVLFSKDLSGKFPSSLSGLVDKVNNMSLYANELVRMSESKTEEILDFSKKIVEKFPENKELTEKIFLSCITPKVQDMKVRWKEANSLGGNQEAIQKTALINMIRIYAKSPNADTNVTKKAIAEALNVEERSQTFMKPFLIKELKNLQKGLFR